ncbi:MAG: hypothetical protein ACRDGJ_02620 [Candidatus Limnocylindria bacterium]
MARAEISTTINRPIDEVFGAKPDVSDISDRAKIWLAAACGLGMVVLLFAAIGALSSAGPILAKDAPTSEVMAWGVHRDALLAYTWLGPNAIILFVLFVLFLARLAEPQGGTASTVALTGAVLLMSVALLNHTLVQSLTYAVGSGDASAATVWAQLRAVDHIFHVANPVVFGGLAFLVLRTGVLPGVFGVVAVFLTAADLVIGPLALFNRSVEENEILPAFALTMWVLAASVFLIWTAVRPGSARSGGVPAGAP